MAAIDMNEVAIKSLEIKDFLLQHWIAVIFGGLFLYLLKNKYGNGLNGIPGPFLAGFTEFYKLYLHENGEWAQTSIALHQKYGPLVRIAPKEVLIADPEALKVMYALRSGFTKSAFYTVFNNFFKSDLFNTLDESLHAWKRKNVSASYSAESVATMEPIMDQENNIFFGEMQTFSREAKEFDLGAWLRLWAWDLSGELAFGRGFQMMGNGGDKTGYIEMIDAGTAFGGVIGQVPFMMPIVTHPLLTSWQEGFKKLMAGKASLIDLTRQRVRERLATEKTDRKDLLGRLVALRDDKNITIDMDDIHTAAIEVVYSPVLYYLRLRIAGSDTTSTTMTMLMYYLTKNLKAYRKLQEEIEATAQGKQISLQQAKEMKYLQCVIKEALRCFPVVGYHLPRVVPKGGKEISGYYFPAGSIVGANAWVIHHNETIFGHDAAKFNPDRWLDPGRAADMDKYMFAFGGGSRTCIGRNFAMAAMSKLVPELLRRFEVQLANPKEELKYDNHWYRPNNSSSGWTRS